MLASAGRVIGSRSSLVEGRLLRCLPSSYATRSFSQAALTTPLHGLNLLVRSSHPKRRNSNNSVVGSTTATSFFDRTSKAFLATEKKKTEGEEETPVTPVPEETIEQELEEEIEEAATSSGLEIEAIKEATRIVSGLPISAIEDYEVEQRFLNSLIESEDARDVKTTKESTKTQAQVFNFAPEIELNVNHFYSFNYEVSETLFPNGLAGWMKDEYKYIRRSGFYLRPAVVNLIERLRKEREEGFVNSQPIFIDGPAGGGKSAALNQIVAWARKNDWIVLFFDGADKAVSAGLIAPSRTYMGLYDNIVLECDILYGMLIAHGDKLKKLPVKTPITVGTFEASKEKPKTLFDLVKYGAQKLNYSGDAFHHFYRELCSVTEYPVMVAVDGIEHLTCPTNFCDPYTKKFKGEPLPGEKLSLSRELVRYNSHPVLNGTFIASLTSKAKNNRFKKELIPEENKVTLPAFTKEDYYNLMNYYSKTGWIEFLKPQALEYVYSASGGLPAEAWKLTKYLQPGGIIRQAGFTEENVTEELLAQLEAKYGIGPKIEGGVTSEELDMLVNTHIDFIEQRNIIDGLTPA